MSKWYIIRENNDQHLSHHGIKGQKLGIRRYQNKNVKVFMLTSNNGDQYVKNILEELNKGGQN